MDDLDILAFMIVNLIDLYVLLYRPPFTFTPFLGIPSLSSSPPLCYLVAVCDFLRILPLSSPFIFNLVSPKKNTFSPPHPPPPLSIPLIGQQPQRGRWPKLSKPWSTISALRPLSQPRSRNKGLKFQSWGSNLRYQSKSWSRNWILPIEAQNSGSRPKSWYCCLNCGLYPA